MTDTGVSVAFGVGDGGLRRGVDIAAMTAVVFALFVVRFGVDAAHDNIAAAIIVFVATAHLDASIVVVVIMAHDGERVEALFDEVLLRLPLFRQILHNLKAHRRRRRRYDVMRHVERSRFATGGTTVAVAAAVVSRRTAAAGTRIGFA